GAAVEGRPGRGYGGFGDIPVFDGVELCDWCGVAGRRWAYRDVVILRLGWSPAGRAPTALCSVRIAGCGSPSHGRPATVRHDFSLRNARASTLRAADH